MSVVALMPARNEAERIAADFVPANTFEKDES
jgi:hypothetical protein